MWRVRTILSSRSRKWSMTRSQVYQELRRLHDADLVSTVHGRYSITEPGRQAATAWFKDFALAEPRDEQVRSPIALSVFFGNYLPVEPVSVSGRGRVPRVARPRADRAVDALAAPTGARTRRRAGRLRPPSQRLAARPSRARRCDNGSRAANGDGA